MNNNLLTIEDLTISFPVGKNNKRESDQIKDGKFVAVDSISMKVRQGQCLGLIGENGSGKSTLQKAIMGLVKTTPGIISQKENLKIGYVHGESQMAEHLTLEENIMLLATSNKVSREDYLNRMETLNEILEFSDFLDVKPNDASSGMKQKINLARSMIHDPELLVLDEPTSAVDIVVVEMFERFIKHEKLSGKGIILTSHYPNEISNLCEDLIILEKGRAIYNGPVNDLEQFETSERFVNALRKQVFANQIRSANENAA